MLYAGENTRRKSLRIYKKFCDYLTLNNIPNLVMFL